ncbi:glycoside hydrolase family 47 protein [Stachybotrys elegans]|uniref:alpha-1,2-Mannosidase n=1 Tax=Stachybotrys elegans TaxID=80388 RepID=A0A8K0T137_9HYPO|nr:glycoside hydrolase family 47 protein [Stachybotrys elegans]
MVKRLARGRPARRYATLFIVLALLVLLWRNYGFWVLPPRSLTSSRTYLLDGVTYRTGSYDWSQAPIFHSVDSPRKPPSGPSIKFPRVQARSSAAEQDPSAETRKEIIKAKFAKSWDAYREHAWPQDELKPLSARKAQSLHGWSAQIVDALDTLWIMGMKDEFHKAVEHVALIDWSRTNDWSINVFEVAIRYLGGLLAAYDLSGEAALLAKAVELGDVLYAAFDTPNRMPLRWFSYGSAMRGRNVAAERMSGAAGGTMSLEFTRLTQLTSDPKYYDAAERVKQFFYKWQKKTKIPGIWPTTINWRDGLMEGERFSLGAGMDSMYEYLPKMAALLGGLDDEYKQMTLDSFNVLKRRALFRPMTPNKENILLTGIAVWREGKILINPEVQHLACHTGGMYALAGKLFSRKDYMDVAARVTRGCVWAYKSFPTGIMPEKSRVATCPMQEAPCKYDTRRFENPESENLPGGFLSVRDSRYLLRPEAIESVFYMWRTTGDQVWRDVAWDMWEAIVKETETDLAFASIEDVMVQSGPKIDSMETFWMGETLKYFYLIFEDESVIDLDEWILNTEAHPIRRPA